MHDAITCTHRRCINCCNRVSILPDELHAAQEHYVQLPTLLSVAGVGDLCVYSGA